MKLGMNEIREGICEAAILKTMRQLEREGFNVEREYRYNEGERIVFDLFAYNEFEKRIYEFKIGRNRIRRDQFEFLQQCAKIVQAKLYVIYLEVPRSKSIFFENIDAIVLKDLSEIPPQELQELATHYSIEDVGDIDIEKIAMSDEIVELRGSGKLFLSLQFGSRYDLKTGDGYEEDAEFEFFFKLKLDVARKFILDRYYKIDTAWYYE